MLLIDKLEETFIKEINELNIRDFDDYLKRNNKAIIFLCDFKEGINEKIEEGLGEFIVKKVRENYYSKLYRGINPEFLEHPEYLAYALNENIFSSNELRKINFQDDSRRNNFIRNHLDGKLLKNLREKLLNSS